MNIFPFTYYGVLKCNLKPNAESQAVDGERIGYCQINRQAVAYPLPNYFSLRNETSEEQLNDSGKPVVRHTAPCVRRWLVLCRFQLLRLFKFKNKTLLRKGIITHQEL